MLAWFGGDEEDEVDGFGGHFEECCLGGEKTSDGDGRGSEGRGPWRGAPALDLGISGHVRPELGQGFMIRLRIAYALGESGEDRRY